MRWLKNILSRLNAKSGSQKCNQTSYKHLSNLSKAEQKEFLDSFDTVFCDCDGVIWRAFGEAIPSAGAAINFLKSQGKKVAFVTNNSILPIEEQQRKFRSCGIDAKEEDIIHPAQSVCDYLKSKNVDGLIYCLASNAFKDLLQKSGFQLVDTKQSKSLETVYDLRAAIYSDEPVKAVVIDVDLNLTAAKLMRSHIHLKNDDCLFVCGAADETIPFGSGEIIGSGPFINVVEKVAKRKAVILGKPGLDLGQMLKMRFQLTTAPQRALFIGDSLTSDVRFAKNCGFQTLLVLSGGTSEADLQLHRSLEEIPNYVANCLGEIIW